MSNIFVNSLVYMIDPDMSLLKLLKQQVFKYALNKSKFACFFLFLFYLLMDDTWTSLIAN